MKTLLSLLIFSILVVACSQKSVQQEPIVTPTPDLKVKEDPRFTTPAPSQPAEELKEVFFEYNQAEIRQGEIAALEYNADWLRKHPQINVQIEGHCDERGTRQYNLELGERRANVVREYLIRHGVEASRLTVVSYGAIPPQSEKTWSRHRKAMFVLIYPSEK